jgi:hypothetical protein
LLPSNEAPRGRIACRASYLGADSDLLFITQTERLKKLHAARATDFYERKFEQLVRVPLLIAGRSCDESE